MNHLTLSLLLDRFAICRLPATAATPEWATRGEFFSITRTTDELSIVCRQNEVPELTACERDWRALKIAGPLDFALKGILASLAAPLAAADISIFVISTFDTDYLLVKAEALETAVTTLIRAGHHVESLSSEGGEQR